jgi:RNA polymerase sigma-70 factor (family 1)
MARPFNTFDDKQLAELLKSDGESVFSHIYERYWDRLYIIARKRLSNKEEAEEVVQDIFCNLWRKRFTLELMKGFDNYFSIAVKYEVINRLAKRAHALKYEKSLAAGLSELDESTLYQIDFNFSNQQFENVVNNLPEKCRIVFKLQHELGYSQKQIASELDISVKTVEAHLSKARKTLKDSFGNLLGLLL